MNRSRPRVPAAIRRAARAFRELPGVDVVWLAVREPRSRTAVIRWADGVRCDGGLGQRIEASEGVGGAILAGDRTWIGRVDLEANHRLSTDERALLIQEDLASMMVVPLRTASLGDGAPRVEGLAYLGRRKGRDFGEEVVRDALHLGDRLARPVRDAQRLYEALQGWQRAWADAVSAHVDAEHCLDAIASRVAADARTVLRSGIGIVYLL